MVTPADSSADSNRSSRSEATNWELGQEGKAEAPCPPKSELGPDLK